MRTCLDTPTEVMMRMGSAARGRVMARHDVEVEVARLAVLIEKAPQHG
jgi:hypothetical protein